MPIGVGGVLYPPTFFDNVEFDFEKIKELCVINLSIVGYDVLIILILSLALRYGKIKSLGEFWRRAVICTWLTISIRFVIDGFGVLSNKVFDNYLLPMAYVLLMIRYLDKEKAIKVVKVLYVCVLINAAVGSCEYFLGQSLLFHEYYMKSVGWYPNTYLAQQYGVSFRCTAFLVFKSIIRRI